MNLTGLKTYISDSWRTNWVFVKVETDSGIYGWGEATLEHRSHTVAQAVAELERGLKGRDLDEIQSWWQDAYRDEYWRGGPVLTSALSAIEMALWDIKGKSLGVPVYQLLGGKVRSTAKCYANAWFANAKTPADFAEAAVRTVSEGYGALKWDPFGVAFRTITMQELRATMDIVEAVHNAVSGTADLMIEAHGRFDLQAAQRIAHALEDLDVMWLEEPLIPGNLANYARLRESTTTPLSLGERLYTRWDFREVFELGCADYIQPDVSHAGGIWEVRTIAGLAEMWQTAFAPHNPSGPVANAATLQLAAASPNFAYLETIATDVPWRSDIAIEAHVIRDGVAIISDAPGLGVDLNEEELLKHPYVVRDTRQFTPGEGTANRPSGPLWIASKSTVGEREKS
jgi:galactonate dehydratase